MILKKTVTKYSFQMVNHHVLWNMTNGSVIIVHPKIPLCHRIEYKQIKHNYV